MGFADILAQVVWNADTGAWEWTAGSGNAGAVSSQLVYEEVTRHIQGMADTLQDLTRDLYAGDMGIAEWQAAVAQQLKNGHLSNAMFAAGGRDSMGAAEFGRVGQTLREQYAYLTNFAQGIANGDISEGQALSRINIYAGSANQSYYDQLRADNSGVGDADLPILRESPGDGNQQCLGSCRCSIEIRDDGAHWIVHNDSESCPDCIGLGSGGPYRLV